MNSLNDYLATALPTITQLKTVFAALKNWESSYRELLKLGKSLPVLPDRLKTDEAELTGCESKVWFYHLNNGEQHFFVIDSEARLIRGLIAVILCATNGKTAAEIAGFDLNALLKEIRLDHHLSPSRTNGLLAIIKQIQKSVSQS